MNLDSQFISEAFRMFKKYSSLSSWFLLVTSQFWLAYCRMEDAVRAFKSVLAAKPDRSRSVRVQSFLIWEVLKVYPVCIILFLNLIWNILENLFALKPRTFLDWCFCLMMTDGRDSWRPFCLIAVHDWQLLFSWLNMTSSHFDFHSCPLFHVYLFLSTTTISELCNTLFTVSRVCVRIDPCIVRWHSWQPLQSVYE